MFIKIPRLYDSHTHFLATGEFVTGLSLHSLKSAQEILSWKIDDANFFRGEWLVGFGWDDRNWPDRPQIEILDRLAPNKPIYFAKADGHTAWVNSFALKILEVKSDSGLLSEAEHLQAWDKLPQFSEQQQRHHILAACSVFNKAGFTHVRDMAGSESLWQSLSHLENERSLTLAVEENFPFFSLTQFETALKVALYCRKNETPLLRSKGVKFYYDGSLGSETAFLSQPYNRLVQGNSGRALWTRSEVETILKSSWTSGVDVSVHTIGDQAAHEIVQIARDVSAQGFVGRLNLEHVQVLRPETIQMMKPLHVRCHMQPCHWLSDREWLQGKLGDLYRFAFPWESLRAAQIPISFGSDAPIEQPSYFANKMALEMSVKARIKKFTGDITLAHSHPDFKFAPETYSIIHGEKIHEVFFQGEKIL